MSNNTDILKALSEQRDAANREALEAEKKLATSRNTQDAIYFNFSYTALKLLGKNLYNNPLMAISELVANGIDAKATEIYVYIDLTDKEHANIEIIDNGSGMSYDDLAEKYVWIGRNKRSDELLTAESKESVMGRKGIGKLAALFLTDKYYIFSRKYNEQNENRWMLNVAAYRNSDFPKLDRLKYDKQLINDVIWQQFEHGTAIKLENVDLRRTGTQRIEGLKRTFSDYYLLDALNSNIWVAVKTQGNQSVTFEKVTKNIAFKNFYSIFNNSEKNIESLLSEEIAFKWLSTFPHIANEMHPTICLNKDNFITSGEDYFHDENGELVKKKYTLVGWIGIHSTIEQKNALDKNFLRNNIYQPNRLRLYVRKKLAVSNYFDMRRSTQTMADYIEGEISFDILDDDDLPDIATSSRQDFLEDERVELLISLVDPIINSLFKKRNEIGQKIRKATTDYTNFLKEQEEEKRKREEELRKAAEKRAEAERLARLAAERNAQATRKQNYFLQEQLSEDSITRAYNTHVIKNNAGRISNNVLLLLRNHEECKEYKEVKNITLASNKILTAVKYYNRAAYELENKRLEGNITEFIKEYIESVVADSYSPIICVVDDPIACSISFPPQDLTVMIENIFSNAQKAQSKSLHVTFNNCDGLLIIKFINDGEKLPKAVDKDQLFEFGYSNKDNPNFSAAGTGVGLYQIQDLICRKMNGEVDIYDNEESGITLEVKIHETRI